MAGLSFNPAFHSAILYTLREGVIHLALPQPEVARQPEFPARALNELLGVEPDSGLSTRFKAAADLIHFASRNLPDGNPLAQLRAERGKTDQALMKGVLHFLEDLTGEAARVLGEGDFQLSLNIWNGLDDPSHWSVLLDQLEEKSLAAPEQRMLQHLTAHRQEAGDWDERMRFVRESFTLKTDLSKAFRKNSTASSVSVRYDTMGFVLEARIWRDYERVLRRLQCLTETRFLRYLEIFQPSPMGGLSRRLFDVYPSFFQRRLTDLEWTASRAKHEMAAIAEGLPQARLARLRFRGAMSEVEVLSLAEAIQKSRLTELELKALDVRGSSRKALEEAALRKEIEIRFR